VTARSFAKRLIFATPLRRLVPNRASNSDPRWWDAQLSGPLAAYLGGTLSIDMRNSATANLIRHHARPNPAVLDIGCAGGTLALALPPFTRYVGVDISQVAIEQARKAVQRDRVSFTASKLEDYEPASFDVIVFNEVLYYAGVTAAVQQAARYAAALPTDGCLIVSLKDEPKAKAIMQELGRSFRLLERVLLQTGVNDVAYAIRGDSERPAYLVAAFKP
jgi:2-polyprenyl-3-methyl-5-hydroxy-6-metoxy-1,4-benzoquinol methylase